MKISTNKEVLNLSIASVGITYTKYDWNKEAGRGWSNVQPDPSSLTQEQCVALLSFRDELDEVEEQLGEANNVELWRERVVNSDRRNWDEFVPFMNFYCGVPELDGIPSAGVMQNMLRALPVTVVLVNGKPKLAARGEVPNLDIEFCRAYLMLGLLPPFYMVNFTYLPSDIEPMLLQACERTIELFEAKCSMKRSMIELIKENQQKIGKIH